MNSVLIEDFREFGADTTLGFGFLADVRAPNKITGANAGGPRQLTMRARWAARVAQFGR